MKPLIWENILRVGVPKNHPTHPPNMKGGHSPKLITKPSFITLAFVGHLLFWDVDLSIVEDQNYPRKVVILWDVSTILQVGRRSSAGQPPPPQSTPPPQT